MKQSKRYIILVVVCLLIAGVIGILISLFGRMKSSSVIIDVKEEIPVPICISLECGEEKIVLYESDSIKNVTQQIPSYSSATEGAIWLTIGDQKYEILSYIDHVDSPIIEITGDRTSLEVLAGTTLFQKKDVFQSSTIMLPQKGNDLFKFDVEKLEKVEFFFPDEHMVLIEDKAQVETFAKALAENEYVQREENDIVGGYIVFLIVDGKRIDFGFSRECIIYNKHHYDVLNPELSDPIYDMLGIEYK